MLKKVTNKFLDPSLHPDRLQKLMGSLHWVFISSQHLSLFGLSPDSVKGSFFPVDVKCV